MKGDKNGLMTEWQFIELILKKIYFIGRGIEIGNLSQKTTWLGYVIQENGRYGRKSFLKEDICRIS